MIGLGSDKNGHHCYSDDNHRNVKNLIQVRPAADQCVCTPLQTPPRPWRPQNDDLKYKLHHPDHQKIHHHDLQECAHINDIAVEVNAI